MPPHSESLTSAHFTLVFSGDIQAFDGNPFKTETPFGIPVVAGVGDAFDALETLRTVNDALVAALRGAEEMIELFHEGVGAMRVTSTDLTAKDALVAVSDSYDTLETIRAALALATTPAGET